ncbi:MAG: hypothetical protein ACR2PT_20000 [Endozoicomonas sp.]
MTQSIGCHGGPVFDETNSDLEHLFEVQKQLKVGDKERIARKPLS